MRVLLASDRSPSSASAAEMLAQLSFVDPFHLAAVSVVPVTASVGFSGMPPVVNSIVQEEEKVIRDHLDTLCTRFAEQAESTTASLVVGPPAYEISQHAKTWNPDLIVMGAVGKSMLERVVLGSVSDFVATHADCSVMIVRPAAPGEGDALPAVTPPKRILIALDNSEEDATLIDFMKSIDWSPETEVHLVHVIEDMTMYRQDLLQHMDAHWEQSKQECESHIHVMQRALEGVVASTTAVVMVEPHIGETLVDYADRHQCDLIVAGDHHRNLVNRMLLGSVSRYLLRYSHCSVAIARDRVG